MNETHAVLAGFALAKHAPGSEQANELAERYFALSHRLSADYDYEMARYEAARHVANGRLPDPFERLILPRPLDPAVGRYMALVIIAYAEGQLGLPGSPQQPGPGAGSDGTADAADADGDTATEVVHLGGDDGGDGADGGVWRGEVALLASGLGFPEGPVVMADGGIVFCDGNTGELRLWRDGAISRYARTGGSPWGAVRGVDGALYVTQGGNVPGSGDLSAVCGIQRVSRDQTVELLAAEVDGYVLGAPNDLAFGPDGRLYFTDSGTEYDPRVEVGSPGRLFVLDSSGDGEMLLERPGVCPNGIAFDAAGELYWTETLAHRVCRLEDGRARVFAQLPDDYFPDGMAFADDGRLFVCTNSPGVTVLSPEGEFLGDIGIGGEHATNCVFSGSTLYVTATRTAELGADERTGTLWRVETDARGLALWESRLDPDEPSRREAHITVVAPSLEDQLRGTDLDPRSLSWQLKDVSRRAPPDDSRPHPNVPADRTLSGEGYERVTAELTPDEREYWALHEEGLSDSEIAGREDFVRRIVDRLRAAVVGRFTAAMESAEVAEGLVGAVGSHAVIAAYFEDIFERFSDEQRKAYERAIAALTPRQREYWAWHLRGFNYVEIAGRMGVTSSAITRSGIHDGYRVAVGRRLEAAIGGEFAQALGANVGSEAVIAAERARILGRLGPRPAAYEAALNACSQRQQAIWDLHMRGVPGAEIARRIGVGHPSVIRAREAVVGRLTPDIGRLLAHALAATDASSAITAISGDEFERRYAALDREQRAAYEQVIKELDDEERVYWAARVGGLSDADIARGADFARRAVHRLRVSVFLRLRELVGFAAAQTWANPVESDDVGGFWRVFAEIMSPDQRVIYEEVIAGLALKVQECWSLHLLELTDTGIGALMGYTKEHASRVKASVVERLSKAGFEGAERLLNLPPTRPVRDHSAQDYWIEQPWQVIPLLEGRQLEYWAWQYLGLRNVEIADRTGVVPVRITFIARQVRKRLQQAQLPRLSVTSERLATLSWVPEARRRAWEEARLTHPQQQVLALRGLGASHDAITRILGRDPRNSTHDLARDAMRKLDVRAVRQEGAGAQVVSAGDVGAVLERVREWVKPVGWPSHLVDQFLSSACRPVAGATRDDSVTVTPVLLRNGDYSRLRLEITGPGAWMSVLQTTETAGLTQLRGALADGIWVETDFIDVHAAAV